MDSPGLNSAEDSSSDFSSIGNSNSECPSPQTSIMESVERLSAEDKRLLRKTWIIVSRDLNDIGGKIFEMIFAQSPDTKTLFPFMKKVNHGKHEKASKEIQFHGLRFMQIIESTIKSLDNPRDLEPLLDNLGRRHGRLTERTNFRPHHWSVFIECTLFHFRALIAHDSTFSSDIINTDRAVILWRIVLKAIIKRMKAGLAQDLRNRKSNRENKMNTNLQNGVEKLSINGDNNDHRRLSGLHIPSPPYLGSTSPSYVGSKSSLDSSSAHSPIM